MFPGFPDRRHLLAQLGQGFGGLVLASMLGREAAQESERSPPGAGVAGGPDQPGTGAALQVLHHPPRAKRVVQLFMAGGCSHLDTFDYKPALEQLHGKEADFGEHVEAFQDGLGPWMKSPWKFRPHGQCGKLLSEIVAPLGACVDEMAFVHNLTGRTGVHSQATFLQATGFQLPGFPGMGSWISYALGSLNDNLPTFVVMPDQRGFASNGTKNWASAFLPGQHQGTMVRAGAEEPIRDLFAPPGSFVTPAGEQATRELLQRFNGRHAATREGDARLEARIRSYELAARMQLAASEALDLSGEPAHVLRLYGLDQGTGSYPDQINEAEETEHFGRKCLIARRLLERGVRFIQIWSGNDNSHPRRNWDSHEDLQRDHGPLALGMARGAAALLQDLKQRGLLDDTIILWTTEFGRMPSSQGGKGRDHNPHVFTNWLAGGGIRGGVSHGASDDWGFKPLDRSSPTEVHDIHATILHLLGIDHLRLTVRHSGIDRRLTDVHGHVMHELIG